jgi:hypothetical protein
MRETVIDSQAAASAVEDEPGQVVVREAVEPGSAEEGTCGWDL